MYMCMCVCIYVREEKGQKQRDSNATWHANMQFSSDARGKPMEDVHSTCINMKVCQV